MNIINIILKRLESLDPYIYYKSKRTNSTYIKFNKANIGSLRISDHKERSKYFYRWNCRFDIDEYEIKETQSFKQHHYPASNIEKMCFHMLNYHKYLENMSWK